MPGLKPPNAFVPGPGQYSPSAKLVDPSISYGYTFLGRRESSDGAKSAVPGPGNYPLASTMVARVPIFGQGKKDRGDEKPPNVPGPGTYDALESIKRIRPVAVFKYDWFRSQITHRFGSAKRYEARRVSNIPGPGAYPAEVRIGKEGRKFSLIGRPKSDLRFSSSPGPAAYTVKDLARVRAFTYDRCTKIT